MMASEEESNSEAEDSSPPPKSRRMRKRKQVDYSEDHVKVIPDTTSSPIKRRRRGAAAPKAKAAAKKRKREEEKDEEDEEEDSAPEKETKKKGTGRPKKNETPKGRNRGTLQERTCPHCKRVFTSTHGRDYHVDHNVCRTDSSKRAPNRRTKTADKTLFDTLEPGSKFVTPYGVVEVVADNRAKPTAKSPEKDSSKKYSVAKGKLEARQRRQWRALSVRNRARRRRLGELYKYQDITQANIFDVYFAGDPRDKAAKQETLPETPPPLKDPMCPEDSYPDRMVDCVLIPDERNVINMEKQEKKGDNKSDSDDDEEASEEKSEEEESQASDGAPEEFKPNSAPCKMKLFLRRRLLTDEYRDSVEQFVCGDCGQKFVSRPGYVYHAHGQVCIKKNAAHGEQTQELHQSIENRVDSLLARSKEDDRTRRRLQRSAVYPQVWATLGYLAPGEIFVQGEDDDEPAGDDSDGEVSDLENPDDIIWDLRNQYLKQKNHLIGPVYPPLYSFLGFSGDTSKRPAVDERVKPKKPRKRRKKASSAMAPPKPLPHIIDVRVLADEVDAGRYPSIKRFEGGHSPICDICREKGTLFNCDFCKSAVHLACIREKHIVKHPEPGDDFLCHKCIAYILIMRGRAEKRRIKKQQDAEAKAGLGKVAQLAPASEEAVGQDAAVEETEYHKLADRGQELNELVELLQDARSRLKESVRVKAMNDARRGTLI